MRIFTLFGRLCVIGDREAYCFDQIEVPEGSEITNVELNIVMSGDKVLQMGYKPKLDVVYREEHEQQ